MRTTLLLIGLAACQREREIGLQLGPSDGTVSIGFRCRQEADPAKLLIQRAPVRNGKIIVSLVIDLIDLGGRAPGCRGEEILTACDPGAGGGCTIPVSANPVRFCQELAVEIGDGNPQRIIEDFRRQARGALLTADAPNAPVIIRAVTTTEDCATLQQSPDGVFYDAPDPFRAVGCAYSCPLQLDAIDGPVFLSLDVLTDRCEGAVQTCAGLR